MEWFHKEQLLEKKQTKDVRGRAGDPIRAPETLTRERVLEQVVLQAVCREGNAAVLEACPHVEVLDLAGLFCVPVMRAGKLEAVGRLQWKDLNALGISLEELTSAARKNTLQQAGVDVATEKEMSQQIQESGRWQGTALEEATMAQRNFYFVSNGSHSDGEVLLLVPEVLEALEEKMGGGFVIGRTALDGLMVAQDGATGFFPLMFRSMLKGKKYWPSGSADHLYHYDRPTGLQFAKVA